MRQRDKECNWFTLIVLCLNVHTVWGQCSGSPVTVTASESPAAFTTPGYPTSYANNLYCEWLIDSGVAGQVVMLYSDHLDLDCSFGDSINISDGNSNSSTALQSALCGSNLQSTEYISSDRYVLVTFITDAVNSGQGFQMTYISAADTSATGCSAEYIYTASTTPQYLTSASFPSKYSSKSSCRWLLTAPGSLSTVSVEVVWSDIEDDATCRYDQLYIYDGQYICENMVLFTDCSSRTAAGSTPATYTSTSNNLLVIFTSDDSYNRYGFIIKYTATIVTTTATTTAASTTTAANSPVAVTSASRTDTDKKLDVTLMAISALVGSAASLLVVALVWKIKRVLTRKKTKPGLMTVQAIAPLPPRSTFLTTRSTPINSNALSFV